MNTQPPQKEHKKNHPAKTNKPFFVCFSFLFLRWLGNLGFWGNRGEFGGKSCENAAFLTKVRLGRETQAFLPKFLGHSSTNLGQKTQRFYENVRKIYSWANQGKTSFWGTVGRIFLNRFARVQERHWLKPCFKIQVQAILTRKKCGSSLGRLRALHNDKINISKYLNNSCPS